GASFGAEAESVIVRRVGGVGRVWRVVGHKKQERVCRETRKILEKKSSGHLHFEDEAVGVAEGLAEIHLGKHLARGAFEGGFGDARGVRGRDAPFRDKK